MVRTSQIKCSCGRAFEVPGELINSSVLCPMCTRVLYLADDTSSTRVFQLSGPVDARTKPVDTEAFNALFRTDQAVPMDWRVGDIYLDLYEVRALIGEGGMGKVFRVYHRLWDEEIAVKCPAQRILALAGGYELFERECDTWVNLGLHPHIVTCYYVRRVGGMPRIFAEYVAGGDLLRWIRNGALYEGGDEVALERILRIATECAWALSFAHSQEIVHRDVKPANVLIAPDGTAKLTDLGLARSIRKQGEGGATRAPGYSGMTPAYCAPEQLHGGSISERCDTWSWAVTVLQMFTRRVAWPDGPSAGDFLVNERAFDDGDGLVPKFPRTLRDLLQHCLQRDPDHRPRSMFDVEQALDAIHREVLGRACATPRPASAPSRAENLNNRAVSMMDLGDTGKAEFLWREGLAVAPNHPETTFNLALHQWRRGQITDEDALALLKRTSQPPNDRADMEAEIHVERGDCRSALDVLTAYAPESPLLESANQCLSTSRRILLSMKHHADAVIAVRVCTARRLVVSASTDNSLVVSNLDTGVALRMLSGHTNRPECLWVDERFTTALTGARDRTVRLWDLDAGNCLWTGRADGSRFHAVALFGNGTSMVAIADQNRAYWFNLTKSTPDHLVQGPGEHVLLTSLACNGAIAVSAHAQGKVTVWDTKTAHVHHVLDAGKYGITCLAFDLESSRIAAGTSEGAILWWSPGQQTPFVVASAHQHLVSEIKFSDNGLHLLTACAGGTCRLWEISGGRCLHSLRATRASTLCADLSDDGTIAAAGDKNGEVTIWQSSASVVFRAASLRLSRNVSLEASVDQDRVFSAALERAACSLQSGQYETAERELRAIRNARDSGARTEALLLWTQLYRFGRKRELLGHWKLAQFVGHEAPIRQLAWDRANARVFAVDDFGELRAWDVKAGTCVFARQAHDSSISDVDYCSEKRLLVTAGADCLVHVWDANSGQLLNSCEGHAAPISSVRFSPDGNCVLSAGWDVRVWESDSGRCLHTIENAMLDFRVVRWAANGRIFVTAGGEHLQVWNAQSYQQIMSLNFRPRMVDRVEITSDSRYAIVVCGAFAAQEAVVEVWDLHSQACVNRLTGASSAIRALNIAGDARHWIVASQDGMARIWGIPSEDCGAAFKVSHTDVTATALTRDAAVYAVGCSDGSITLWAMDWQMDMSQPADWEEQIRPILENVLAAKLRSQRPSAQSGYRLSNYLPLGTASGRSAARHVDPEDLREALSDAGYGWLTVDQLQRAVTNCLKQPNSKTRNPLWH